ncbi:helix-turn-helix domain-containing protein [Latilactobacillus graminis]|uniref:Helix-turn-helix family protein n=2 Tax=Latilactobacillus graminis TaxID=60519 RepID=A0AA89L0A1_9LACO|nr:helix-turn-helix transcriptional regulator [Latilactobacillus graminis]KRM22309.1 helix-turn-helix family protein [Latilactobacillus graminis DSM 20719]QFP79516.1 helix-turn-helix transcriptional regulator [Latilactobacillus graminis]
MFLGQTIHQKRLKKQLTQSELAAGICTQNTISKIEKKNLPPTIPILIKICLRLDLTLNELFTEFNAINAASDAGVIAAESALLAGDINPATEIIRNTDLTAANGSYPAIFFFFQGYLSYLNHKSELQIFSAYNTFTASISDEVSTLKLLLNTGMGLIYQDAGEQLASFYFNNNISYINQLTQLNTIDIQRVLFATRYTAEYLMNQDNLKEALALIENALKLSQQNQNIKQIDQLYYLKAIILKKSNGAFKAPLATALTFAEFLKNTALTDKINALK